MQRRMMVSTIFMAVTATLAIYMLSGCDKKQAQLGQSSDVVPLPSEPTSTPSPSPSVQPTALPEGSVDAAVATAGLPQALNQYGCYACHDVNGARIGPPYRAIAGLYRNDPQAVDKLTQKIINGGSGVWGPTPMIAHYHLAPEQIEPLVEAIIKPN